MLLPLSGFWISAVIFPAQARRHTVFLPHPHFPWFSCLNGSLISTRIAQTVARINYTQYIWFFSCHPSVLITGFLRFCNITVVLYIDLVQMPMQECRFWSNPYNYLILLQVTFCIILPVWSICLIFCCFAPIHSSYNSSGLERLLDCRGFYSNPLFVQFFRLGASTWFSAVSLQPTCFLWLTNWGIFPNFRCFAPTKKNGGISASKNNMVYINNHFLTDAYSTLSSSQCL